VEDGSYIKVHALGETSEQISNTRGFRSVPLEAIRPSNGDKLSSAAQGRCKMKGLLRDRLATRTTCAGESLLAVLVLVTGAGALVPTNS